MTAKPQQWLVQFKNETHNHPTEIEPFGGAATCLGGAIRDPLSGTGLCLSGYACHRLRRSSNFPLRIRCPASCPAAKSPPARPAGYSSYGNQIGLATGQVTELYDPGYVAKRMEIGAVIGASPKANVMREAPMPGDVIVLLGGAPGGTAAAAPPAPPRPTPSESIETCGAEVQKGNPPTERKIQRLFRDRRGCHA